MKNNYSIYMMSAIAVLVFACAILGYSSMSNKSRALTAESELSKLQKELEKLLEAKNVPKTAKQKPPSQPAPTFTSFPAPQAPPAENRDENSGQQDRQDRGRAAMEKLKETDPERYAAMVERMNNFTKQMHENSAKQVDFMKKLDTKSMTPEQLDNHNKLQPLVARNNQLLYELTQNPEGDNASNIRREMFDNSRQMRDLLDTERSVALQQFATQLGYRSDQTAQFEEYIKYVYDMTSSNPFRGGGNRGPQGQGQGQPNR